MANDRMFLANKKTKKFLCIAKHLDGPWYVSNLIEKLEDFFCDEANKESFWEEEHNFELLYEDQITVDHIQFEK